MSDRIELSPRVLHVHIDADLHRALLVYEAERGLTHGQVVEQSLRLLLKQGAE